MTSVQRRLVRFTSEMCSERDFSSKRENSLGRDVSCVGCRRPIHPELQLDGAIGRTSVHTAFQQLQFHGPLSLIQNPPGSVTSNAVNRNSFLLSKTFLHDGAHWFLGLTFENGTRVLRFEVLCIILKLSTQCNRADILVFLFQPTAHKKLNTYIYHLLPTTCSGVCYSIFGVTIARFVQELYDFSNVGTYGVLQNIKYTMFLICVMLVTMFTVTCSSFFCNILIL
jgi:hypothetical protein